MDVMPPGDVNNRVSLLLSIMKRRYIIKYTRHVSVIYFIGYTTSEKVEVGKPKDLNMIANVSDDHLCLRVIAMVFNATFNKISVISWRSALLVKVASH